jgi:VanZ family protein
VPNTPPLGKPNHILIAPARQFRFSFAVLKPRPFLKYWLPALIWMALIFSASADSHSYEHSSLFVEPFLHWLFPQMSEAQVKAIHHLIRKCGHLTEYAVLALLLWRAVRRPVKKDPRPWIWPEAGLALAIVFLVAASDEFHQIFVPTRTALVSDVFIDTAGGAAGLLALWAIGRWRKHW